MLWGCNWPGLYNATIRYSGHDENRYLPSVVVPSPLVLLFTHVTSSLPFPIPPLFLLAQSFCFTQSVIKHVTPAPSDHSRGHWYDCY
jgi:hypothetical protein